MDDGVIKFLMNKVSDESSITDAAYFELNTVRSELVKLNMIGVDVNGIGFGNISMRSNRPNSFYISASQTGNLESLERKHYSEVVNVDLEEHSLEYIGMPPSSESISHFAIYDAVPGIKAVIHIHHQKLWEAYYHSHPYFTSKDIEYGSLEMSQSISELAKKCGQIPIINMHGHQGGIIAFGPNLKETFMHLTEFNSRLNKNLV